MTGMDDLATWLRAVWDEDERVALEAAEFLRCGCHPGEYAGRWSFDFNERVRTSIHDVAGGGGWSADLNPPVGEHIARWDPARVLAEIDAKRKLLDLHADSDFPHDPDGLGPGSYSWTAQCQGCYEDAPCLTARLLALPYADRPGHREEWRPDTPSKRS